jgi:hypothetical protein
MDPSSIQASEIRELSLDELDEVEGGKGAISVGPVRIVVYDDGAFSVGLKGIGSLLFDGGVQACPDNGQCVPLV